MNRKAMGYKPPVPPQARPQSKPPVQRDPKSRPEWVTDFVDTDKYKLTEAERIQKKAERQSSNRQAAKEQMAQRMRKLQQGIVDQDTRKVYQISLTSKGIELNPPLRRNLSQMIAYQRDIQIQSREEWEESQGDQGSDVEKQLKNTQQFIKRMEKANKVKSITQAIEILQPSVTKPLNMFTHNSSGLYGKTQSDFTAKSKRQHGTLNIKEELSPLENIEGTMNFLQNLLRNREPHNESLTLQLPNFSRNIHQELQSFSKQIIGGVYHTERMQEDLNTISFQDKKDESPIPNRQAAGFQENQWSNTITRMQNLMQNKDRQYTNRPGPGREFEYTVVANKPQQEQYRQFYSTQQGQDLLLPSMSSLDDQEKQGQHSSRVLKNSYFRHIREEGSHFEDRVETRQEAYQSSPSMFSLNYSRKEHHLSYSKQNSNRMNIEERTQKAFEKQDEIEFSLTLNNSELKMDTDRFFDPIHEQEEYIRSSAPQKTAGIFTKPKRQNLVQEDQPEQCPVRTKHVTFKNQKMFKLVCQEEDSIEQSEFLKYQRNPVDVDFSKKSVNLAAGERKSLNSPAPQKTAIHQPNKEADKIRKLLQETKTNMSKLATEKYEIPSSVSLKRQLR